MRKLGEGIARHQENRVAFRRAQKTTAIQRANACRRQKESKPQVSGRLKRCGYRLF